jgi:hypothetical protein
MKTKIRLCRVARFGEERWRRMAGGRPLDLDEGEPGLGLVDLPDVQSLVILDTLLHLVRTESLRRAPELKG